VMSVNSCEPSFISFSPRQPSRPPSLPACARGRGRASRGR
jgi:hypothetical protein